jgi:TRAP-type C4-dicarboxylate transport system permease small subunit
LIILIYSVLTLLVLYAVFMRYVINAAPTWSEEIARYLMVWVSLLALGPAIRAHRHIGLSSLVSRLWKRYTPHAFFVADLFILAFFLVVLVAGISMTIFVAGQRSPSANIPMWVAYMAVPAGALFMILETLILMVKKLIPQEREEVIEKESERISESEGEEDLL